MLFKRSSILVLSALLSLINLAHAGQPSADGVTLPPSPSSGRQSTDDAWWTGPLLAPNPASLHQGGFDFEPYLIDSSSYGHFDRGWNVRGIDDRSNSYLATFLFKYGLSDNFTLWIKPSIGYDELNHGKNSSSPQLGDTTVRLQYMFTKFHEGSWIPTVSLIVGESFPTGQYDELGSRPANGLGNGSFGTILALYTGENFWLPTGRILRARLDLTYTFQQDDVNVAGVSVYGTGQHFHGSANPGNSFVAELGLEYSLTRNWVPALDIVYGHTDGTQVHGYDVQRLSSGLAAVPANSNHRSSESFNVAPALEYNWNKNWGVIAGVEVTFAGRNTTAYITPQIALNIMY